jgi:hypothetical protein
MDANDTAETDAEVAVATRSLHGKRARVYTTNNIEDDYDDDDFNDRGENGSPLAKKEAPLTSFIEDTSTNINDRALNSIRSELLGKQSRRGRDQLKQSLCSFKLFNESKEDSEMLPLSSASSSSSTSVCSSSSSSASSSSAHSNAPSPLPDHSDPFASYLALSESLKMSLNLGNDTQCDDTAFNSLAAALLTQQSSSAAAKSNSSSQFQFRPINKIFKYGLNNLNLMKKDTLLFLIESSSASRIVAPFDELAYARLTKMSGGLLDTAACFGSASVANVSASKLDFNYQHIKRLHRLLKEVSYNPLDRKFLKRNALLPNCVSNLFMPFYFDVFRMTEMQSLFNKEQVELVLNLKKSFAVKTSQLMLDYNVLTSYFKENVVWNCLVLFKYKQPKRELTQSVRLAYFNFYLSFVYIQIHLESVVFYHQNSMNSHNSSYNNKVVKDHMKKAIELGLLLPCLLDALISNGLFTHTDYVKFKRFCRKQLLLKPPQAFPGKREGGNVQQNAEDSSFRKVAIDLESKYYENATKSVEAKCETCFPLTLKHLCRIKVKNCMTQFDVKAVNSLNLPGAMKSFLLFDDEIGRNFLRNRNLFSSNS